jgi:pSer/pThr/pTyr-binding forkhead associated (FHA) protein
MSEKTVYPGAPVNNYGNQQGASINPDFHHFSKPVKANDATKKPILGFLYSVSKDYAGEYWPLYLGANTIGRGEDYSISLNEGTVSQRHATIVIRQMQNQGEHAGLFVFIQDVGSMCGTQVNGVTLDFNPKECKNGDIITIGENYEMYFILIEPKQLGLAPKENFKSVSEPVQDEWSAPVNNMFSGNMNKGTLSGDGATSLEGRMTTIYRPQK